VLRQQQRLALVFGASVLAGSSCTSVAVVHSGRTLPSSRPLANPPRCIASTYLAEFGSSRIACARRASASRGSGVTWPMIVLAGYAEGLFQYRSNSVDTCLTASPTATTSRSTSPVSPIS
jgi:hypothetical protein